MPIFSSYLLQVANLFFIAILLSQNILIGEFSQRQQLLIDRMKESIRSKTTSASYGDEFVNLLKEADLGGTAILRFTVNQNGICSTNLVYGPSNITRIPYVKSRLRQHIKGTKNVDFFVSLQDGNFFTDTIKNFVKEHIIFLSCEDQIGEELSTIIPDFYIANTDQFGEKIKSIRKKRIFTPFLKRITLAKFIGAQTGGIYSLENINEIPRLKAFHLARSYPQFLKIDFTSYTCQAANQEYIDYMYHTFGPPAKAEPQIRLLDYRYLLCFDGNTSAWERPEIIMHSGSVPLFQTRFEKFWTLLLEDGVNYLKIENDLSNLIDIVKLLNDHPEYAQKVAKEAQSLAEDVLTPSFINTFFSELFKEVASLQN